MSDHCINMTCRSVTAYSGWRLFLLLSRVKDLDWNKTYYLWSIAHITDLICPACSQKDLCQIWEVSNTHEYEIALQFHQYHAKTWTCYSTLVLLRITRKLNNIEFYTLAWQVGPRKQRIEWNIRERVHWVLPPLRTKELKVSQRKIETFRVSTSCFLSVVVCSVK